MASYPFLLFLAGKSRHVPTIIHESDMTPGLANKISMPSASKICCNFPETIEHLPAGKAVLTGSPIRQELLSGDKYKALEFLHFTQDKPVIMVVGGSLVQLPSTMQSAVSFLNCFSLSRLFISVVMAKLMNL